MIGNNGEMSSGGTTLQQIATECGVSIMTVSRALDPRKNASMRPETRARVLEAVDRYGYASNLTARRLKRRKAEAITLIMAPRTMTGPKGAPDFDAHYENISWGIVKGVITEARRYNYDVKLEAMLDYDRDEDVIPHIKPQLTDGVLLFHNHRIINYLKECKIPYLAVSERYGPDSLCALSTDREPGYAEAVEKVLQRGHRLVAYIGCDRINSSNYNLTLLRKLLSAKDCFDERLVFSVNTAIELRNLLLRFNGNFPFSAVFCHNDTMADLLIRELQFLKIKMPEQIAVIGFDGNPAYCGENRSNPASIVIPWQELAARGTQKLIETIENGENDDIGAKTVPTFFSIGQTL